MVLFLLLKYIKSSRISNLGVGDAQKPGMPVYGVTVLDTTEQLN